MSKERITILNNEKLLRQISVEVDFSNDTYLDDIAKLKEFCQNDGMFALAPVQIGIPKRIIYIRNTTSDTNKNFDIAYDEGKIFINPIILKRKGLTRFLEGCASCPDIDVAKSLEFNINESQLVSIVDRPYLMEIEYYDIDGNKKNEALEGFESTVFSHEYDHLNGILHIDLTPEIFKMDLQQRTEYRKMHPYEIISKDCEYEPLKKQLKKQKWCILSVSVNVLLDLKNNNKMSDKISEKQQENQVCFTKNTVIIKLCALENRIINVLVNVFYKNQLGEIV